MLIQLMLLNAKYKTVYCGVSFYKGKVYNQR
jgi:hypothetical protein